MKLLAFITFLFISVLGIAQDMAMLLKQASNYEKSLKEDSALLKYSIILQNDDKNIKALVKSSLLTASIAAKMNDKLAVRKQYDVSLELADRALLVDSNFVDALYARGLLALQISEIEPENKKMIIWIREAHDYATKALKLKPNHGKSNFLLGKWNFGMLTTAWAKKAAMKVFLGGMPNASIDNAILYMENCRIAEPYFVENFLELGKAYKFNNNPSKAIEVLSQLIKLPNRTSNDAGWKAVGKKLLSDMQ